MPTPRGGFDSYYVSLFALEHRLDPARALGNISARSVNSWDDAAEFARGIEEGNVGVAVALVAARPEWLAEEELGAYRQFEDATKSTLVNVVAVRWPAALSNIPSVELLGQFAGVVVQIEDRAHCHTSPRFVSKFRSSFIAVLFIDAEKKESRETKQTGNYNWGTSPSKMLWMMRGNARVSMGLAR
jgi:hypothetical protein